MERGEIEIRRAVAADADVAARLLHDFNAEYEESTPPAEELAGILRPLIASAEVIVLFAGGGPDGISLMRLRPAIWARGQEAYLQELYVVPPLRGQGIGRALLEATMDEARRGGALGIDLNTGETDTEARGLYESSGFTNREGSPDGPAMLFYEREL